MALSMTSPPTVYTDNTRGAYTFLLEGGNCHLLIHFGLKANPLWYVDITSLFM